MGRSPKARPNGCVTGCEGRADFPKPGKEGLWADRFSVGIRVGERERGERHSRQAKNVTSEITIEYKFF